MSPLKLKFIQIIFKDLVPTAQKAYCVSITNTGQLTLFNTIIAVHMYETHKYTAKEKYGRCVRYSMEHIA
jgi:hypothetical protein